MLELAARQQILAEKAGGKCEVDVIQKESGKEKGRKLKTVLTVTAGRSRIAEGTNSPVPTKTLVWPNAGKEPPLSPPCCRAGEEPVWPQGHADQGHHCALRRRFSTISSSWERIRQKQSALNLPCQGSNTQAQQQPEARLFRPCTGAQKQNKAAKKPLLQQDSPWQ